MFAFHLQHVVNVLIIIAEEPLHSMWWNWYLPAWPTALPVFGLRRADLLHARQT
jgi:hypothetical protein